MFSKGIQLLDVIFIGCQVDVDIFCSLGCARLSQGFTKLVYGHTEVVTVEGITRTGDPVDLTIKLFFLQVIVEVETFFR